MSDFTITTTPRFERLAIKLIKHHPEFRSTLNQARAILATDPHNRIHNYHIKKLEGVPHGDGQWRLALGRFRFRYDVANHIVLLSRCGLRREDTYR